MDCNQQCDTCAFGKNGAATEPYNRLRGLICSLGPITFACHHTRDGREFDWHDKLSFVALPRAERRICAGWKAEVRRNRALGLFASKFQVIRRAVAQAALQWIDVFSSTASNKHQKAQAKKKIDKQIRFLTAKDVGPRKIPL